MIQMSILETNINLEEKMRIVVQRVSKASVKVDGKITRKNRKRIFSFAWY